MDIKLKQYTQYSVDFNPEYYVHSYNTNVSIDSADNSPDGELICVGGSQQLKILSLKESNTGEIQIEQNKSLASGNVNVNHVSWCHKNKNFIATSYQVGNKLNVYDLSKGQVSQTFKEHTSMAHKVYWHPEDENILISASRDKTVKIWDKRSQNSTHTFTLRDSAQDVKFYPKEPQHIVTGEENGQIQLFSIHNTQQAISQTNKHIQTVYCIDFNPNQPSYFASGSLDKKVSIWKIDGNKQISELTKYNHIVGVGQVKWSISDPRELIVSGFNMNNEIHVVNLQYPYRPYKIYNGHTEQVTAILFKNEKYLISCSKGKQGTILTRLISNGYKPYDFIPRNLITIDLNNNIGFKLGQHDTEQNLAYNELNKTGMKSFFTQLSKNNDDRLPPHSVGICETLNNKDFTDPKEELIFFAKNYKIEANITLREKAEYNSKIAKLKNKLYTSKLWIEFADIFCPKTAEDQSEIQKNKQKSDPKVEESKKEAPLTNGQLSKQNQNNEGLKINQLQNNEQIKEELDPELIFKYFENNQSGLIQALNNEDLIHQNDNTLIISQYLKEQILQQNSQEKTQKQKIKLANGEIHPTVMKSCVDSLQELIDLGELQSAVVISLVFGESLVIDQPVKTQWGVDLVELFRSYRLYNYANYYDIFISKDLKVIQTKKQFLTKCVCGKSLDGPKCDSCNKIIKCSYCKLPVKGLLLWCQVCAHGGHAKELSQWFKTNTECPTGCGHNCFSSLKMK
ncbi:WD domain, G-beta repeat protein (macronuclear) [Tetrahymena thermophila SB210]|uniref:WD domain, G-beta repeat protein n=1 Tax=Tetrahymena thermophila (strain SB210) TaxID=312017 RepID=I7MG57_TETTS|nr:WD domain, G-beta repeat protein [Tetrahymena thermophila SB210]EAS01120.2 WD domain, G-beta repeat protein [Tetrahymena thermophila SB210]|eukprot:XP_001021365.2 WD domain, G-beta repeat protein [Tetrahymena thermophila SB210]